MHLDLVHDYIWLSDLEAAADASKLDALNICHVLSVGCDVQGATNFVKSNRTIRYMALPDIRDEPEANLMRLFPQMLTFLHEASLEKGTNRNIVVHCVHGQSRSAATVVAYLSSSFSGMNMNLEDTLTFLKDRCPRICINPGFLSQMHLYYNRMHYPAEYSLAMRGTVTHNNDIFRSENEQDERSTTNERGSMYVLRCLKCRYALLHAKRSSPECTMHIPVLNTNDANYCEYACAVAHALARSFVAPSSDTDFNFDGSDYVGPDIREQLLVPRPDSAALLKEHLDPYYHGYTSTLEYDRYLVKLEVPIDLAPKQSQKKKKKTEITSDIPDYGPAISLYVHPDGWIHKQITDKAKANTSEIEWEINCPNPSCASSIGIFRKGGLRVCDGFLKTYLTALFMRKTQWEYY
jgi:hypothetical protein